MIFWINQTTNSKSFRSTSNLPTKVHGKYFFWILDLCLTLGMYLVLGFSCAANYWAFWPKGKIRSRSMIPTPRFSFFSWVSCIAKFSTDSFRWSNWKACFISDWKRQKLFQCLLGSIFYFRMTDNSIFIVFTASSRLFHHHMAHQELFFGWSITIDEVGHCIGLLLWFKAGFEDGLIGLGGLYLQFFGLA